MRFLRKHGRDLIWIGAVLALFASVNLLPPDHSASEVKDKGILRVCVPIEYSPFMTAEGRGIEIEILEAVAKDLDVRLVLNRIAAMGRDSNPSSWRINRASCNLIAAGLVRTDALRAFLDFSEPYLETGWIHVHRHGEEPVLLDQSGAVYLGALGKDRLALSRLLRSEGVRGSRGVQSLQDGAQALATGEVDFLIADALLATALEADARFALSPLQGTAPEEIGLGFWKGDLTLKRAVAPTLRRLQESGDLAQIAARYGVTALD